MNSAPNDLDDLRATLAALPPIAGIVRAVVLDEVGSTQDAARELAANRPGLLVVAGRQTSGRGRLGRSWADTAHAGLAMTLALPSAQDPAMLSLRAGLASCLAAEALLPSSRGAVGLRWPNDVVEASGARRKLSGVLVEQAGDIALLGVGINVAHHLADFPASLPAVSLRMLGSTATRAQAAFEFLRAWGRCRTLDHDALATEWRSRDALAGRRLAFLHNGERFEGVVRGIVPSSHVELLDDLRGLVRLPALTTSLDHADRVSDPPA